MEKRVIAVSVLATIGLVGVGLMTKTKKIKKQKQHTQSGQSDLGKQSSVSSGFCKTRANLNERIVAALFEERQTAKALIENQKKIIRNQKKLIVDHKLIASYHRHMILDLARMCHKAGILTQEYYDMMPNIISEHGGGDWPDAKCDVVEDETCCGMSDCECDDKPKITHTKYEGASCDISSKAIEDEDICKTMLR